MLETIVPTSAISNVSAKRGQATQTTQYINRLGYPIAVILKNGINFVIHPAERIPSDGTFTIATTYCVNSHATLNQLANFNRECPELAKKIPQPTAANPRNELLTIEYTVTDDQVGYSGAYYISEIDIVVCTSIAKPQMHPGSHLYEPNKLPDPTTTKITLTGAGAVDEVHYVIFAGSVFELTNMEDGNAPFLTFFAEGNIPRLTALSPLDIFKAEDEARAALSVRASTYNDTEATIYKEVKTMGDGYYRNLGSAAKDYVSSNEGLIGTLTNMSSSMGKLEQEVADAKLHQRKVAGETIKLVHPIVTTLGKVAAL